MRTCYWCGSETPVIPDARWGVLTRSGAIVPPIEGEELADNGAICLACWPEVQAILQAHAWGEAHDDA